MATTWNPSDKAASITLSGGNLIATSNSITQGGVRTIDNQSAGQFYWEYTVNTLTAATNHYAGLAASTWNINASQGLGSGSGTGTTGVGLSTSSSIIYVDGASSGTNIGALASGGLICVAADFTAKRIWYRNGAAGNWNNNVANNPATGVGGISIPNLGGGTVPAYPALSMNHTNDRITGNFGDSAFTGAVPSGFNSGFVAGGTTQARVMVLA